MQTIPKLYFYKYSKIYAINNESGKYIKFYDFEKALDWVKLCPKKRRLISKYEAKKLGVKNEIYM